MNQHCLIMHRPARKSIVFILPLESYYTGKNTLVCLLFYFPYASDSDKTQVFALVTK